MNFSLFTFNESGDKKDKEPKKVVCVIEHSSGDKLFRFVSLLASLATIGALIFSAMSYSIAAISYKKSVETEKIQKRPIPVIYVTPDISFMGITNKGENPIESLKGYYRVIYDHGKQTVISEDKLSYKLIKKNDIFTFATNFTYDKLSDPSSGFVFIIVVFESPSLDKTYTKIYYTILSEKDRWYETDESLWALGRDHRLLISSQLNDINNILKN